MTTISGGGQSERHLVTLEQEAQRPPEQQQPTGTEDRPADPTQAGRERRLDQNQPNYLGRPHADGEQQAQLAPTLGEEAIVEHADHQGRRQERQSRKCDRAVEDDHDRLPDRRVESVARDDLDVREPGRGEAELLGPGAGLQADEQGGMAIGQ